jgi:hypothetical protein
MKYVVRRLPVPRSPFTPYILYFSCLQYFCVGYYTKKASHLPYATGMWTNNNSIEVNAALWLLDVIEHIPPWICVFQARLVGFFYKSSARVCTGGH